MLSPILSLICETTINYALLMQPIYLHTNSLLRLLVRSTPIYQARSQKFLQGGKQQSSLNI